jgi:hypothetical protein
MPDKIRKNLDAAIKSLQIADHMTYITYPLVNEKRLLLKIFDEIYQSIITCVSVIIEQKGKESGNINFFIKNYARSCGLSYEEIKKISHVMDIKQKQKESGMDFVKKNKVVILSDNLTTEILDLRKIKEYLLIAKKLLMKANK